MTLLQNAVYVPSQDKFYLSFFRHDFVSFKTTDGEHFIDGGCSLADGDYYFRASFNAKNPPKDIVPYYINEEAAFEEVKQKLLWGTRGKDGKGELEHKLVIDLTSDHLKAILKTQKGISDIHRKVIKSILQDRKEIDNWVDSLTANNKGTKSILHEIKRKSKAKFPSF